MMKNNNIKRIVFGLFVSLIVISGALIYSKIDNSFALVPNNKGEYKQLSVLDNALLSNEAEAYCIEPCGGSCPCGPVDGIEGGEPTPIDGECGNRITGGTVYCNVGLRSGFTQLISYESWTCNGIDGGYNAFCEYDLPINGTCGSTINSCLYGTTFSDLTDDASYNKWMCLGVWGGTNTNCQIAKINGACGGTIDTCSTGTFNNLTDDASYNNWQCLGTSNGTNINCQVAKINGVCNNSVNNACTVGGSVDIADSGTQYLWNCVGLSNGATANCALNKPVPVNPTVGNPTPASVGVGSNFTVSVTATDPLSQTIRYEFDYLNNDGIMDANTGYGASGWSTNGIYSYSSGGTKNFGVRACSSDGRCSGWVAKTVTVVPLPTTSITVATSTTYNSAKPLSWSSTGATSCDFTKNGTSISTSLSLSTSTGGLISDTTYQLTCYNSIGQGNSTSATIRLVPFVSFGYNPHTCYEIHNVGWTSFPDSSCSVYKDGVLWQTGGWSQASAGYATTTSMTFSWTCTSPTGVVGAGSTNIPALPLTGVCGSTVNACNAQNLTDTADDAVSYKWDCFGACGGTGVSCSILKPPVAPTITGPATGAISTNYNFSISGTDPSALQVRYAIDWDNDDIVNATTTLGASGWTYTATNNWAGSGAKYFKVRTVTSDGRTSAWSATKTFTVYDPPTATLDIPNPYTLVYNASGTSNVFWSSTNATSCSITRNGAAWQSGGPSGGALYAFAPATTDLTMVLTCSGLGGSSSNTKYMYLKPAASASFSSLNVPYNGAVSIINWTAGGAQSCTLYKGGISWITRYPDLTVGTTTGPLQANTTLELICLSTSGNATSTTFPLAVTVGSLNGACSATHYSCSAGSSANNVNGALKWTWNCNGANGGTNASCEETKPNPNAPTITGPTQGKINTNYTFNFTATNPTGDPIRYAIDWDNNGTVDGYLPVSGTTTQGTTLQWTNQWAGSGIKTFKVRTETNGGPVSTWTTHNITLYGTISVSWTPSSQTISFGDVASFGYSSTETTYCNLYSTVAGDPNTWESTPFASSTATSSSWSSVGPYFQTFKRRAICFNPFGDYASADMTINVNQDNSTCSSVTGVPSYLTPGETFSPTVKLVNSGLTTWYQSGQSYLNVQVLGTEFWGNNKYLPLITGPVSPGVTGEFKAGANYVTAPMAEGYYFIYFAPRHFVGATDYPVVNNPSSCLPTTPHPSNQVLVKVPTLGIGDTDIDQDSLSFPNNYVAGDPAIQKSITVRNRGGGTVTGSVSIPPSKFTCVSGCNFVLGPGATSTVTVEFQSSATGTFAEIMSVNSDAGNKTVTLDGRTGAKFTITVSPLDFGDVAVSRAKYLNLEIENNSLVQTSGSFTISPSAPFYCESGCSATLAALQSTTARIRFSPSTSTPSSISQNVVINSTPNVTITLIGRGVKPEFKVEER